MVGTREWAGELTITGPAEDGVVIVGSFGQILGGGRVDQCVALGCPPGVKMKKSEAPHSVQVHGWVIADLMVDPKKLILTREAEVIATQTRVVSAMQSTIERIAAEASEAVHVEKSRRLGTQDAVRAMMQETLHGSHDGQAYTTDR